MTTAVLRFIPEDPAFAPDAGAGDAACAVLTAAAGRPATARRAAGTEFVAPGGGVQSVRCPACGGALELAWWQERFDQARATAFAQLEAALPCCGADTSLHDLAFEPPAGFARFVLEVPDPAADVEDRLDLDALEGALGVMLRRIV